MTQETQQENMEDSFHLRGQQVQMPFEYCQFVAEEPPFVLLLLWPKQQRKEAAGEGGQNERGRMVDRLGA